MAWRCSGQTNSQLVKNLRQAGLFQLDRTESALLRTDRVHYVQEKSRAYEDAPQSIGFDATISAPHMHCCALDLLSPVLERPNCRVLDVGCGSGYLSACLYRMTEEQCGKVVGMEYLEPLVELSKKNLAKDDPAMLQGPRKIEIVLGDGWEGYSELAPFDAIHVGAAASELPKALLEQLGPGGRMIIPVGEFEQELLQVDKSQDNQSYSVKTITGVRYVPLVRKPKQEVANNIYE